ncbi:hypothetical protein VU10_03430, partial [Desulfobulbus sp. US1]|nr:hypothetical protein [Desulfobulbus sp. US1]
FSTLAAGQNQAEWLNDRVTIKFQEEPMNTVLGEIAQQTGIAILYDEKLADQKVTGYYKGVKFSEAINRLFSEKNKSIQVFKSEKKIIVKTFGAKQFILASSDQPSEDSEEMTSVSADNLKSLHEKQKNEFKQMMQDDNEKFGGSMTKAQLSDLHKKQKNEFKQMMQDDNEKFGGSMTKAQLSALHEKQLEEINNSQINTK